MIIVFKGKPGMLVTHASMPVFRFDKNGEFAADDRINRPLVEKLKRRFEWHYAEGSISDLDGLGYRDLQKLAKESGLNASGKSEELLDRLKEYFGHGGADTPEEPAAQEGAGAETEGGDDDAGTD